MAIKNSINLIQIADLHLPYISKTYSLVKRIIKDQHPDILVINGDFLEAHSISMHSKSPLAIATFREEILCAISELEYLRKHCKKMVFIEGNHCFRLFRLVQNTCPQLFDVAMVTIKDLLQLDRLKIDFIPYGPKQKYRPWQDERFVIMHKPSNTGINSAQLTLHKNLCSTLAAHTHRSQSIISRDVFGEQIFSISSPCLCDIDSELFSYTPAHNTWSNGLVRILKDSRGLHPEIFIDDNGQIRIDGKTYA